MHQKYLLILFYSATGAVKNLAHAIADGAEKKGLAVKIRTVQKSQLSLKLSSQICQIKVKFTAQKKILLIALEWHLAHQPDLAPWQLHSSISWIQQERFGLTMNWKINLVVFLPQQDLNMAVKKLHCLI